MSIASSFSSQPPSPSRFAILGIAMSSLLVTAATVMAEAVLPDADAPGSQDSPLLKRYQGSFILLREHRRYAELALPLSRLEPVPDKIVGNNDRAHEPKSVQRLAGAHTRLIYLMPAERSPLEVLRNYQQELVGSGGQWLFECQGVECGGDPQRSSAGGGGDASLAMFLYPSERITAEYAGSAWCALAEDITEQHYGVAELPAANAHVSVLVYTIVAPDEYDACLALNGRTVAAVDIVEATAREQNMVTVSASAMAQAIASTGKIALYGIHFDFDRAELRPDSKAQLDEIAAMLRADPALKLLVVGHTDNVGDAPYNADLSQRRAAATVAALVGDYAIAGDRLAAQGMGSASPVASNDDEAGRARNRRVELVKQ